MGSYKKMSNGNLSSQSGDLNLFKGRINSMAVTRSGSNALQNFILNRETVKSIREEMMTDAVDLMLDRHAAYVFCKVISLTDQVYLYEIVDVIANNFYRLSDHPSGTHVVQKILKMASTSQRDAIVIQLENYAGLVQLLRSKFGSHVVQACLPYIRPRTAKFMADCLVANMVSIGCDEYGGYCVQKMITRQDVREALVGAVMANVDKLARDRVGTWLVQAVLKLQEPKYVFLVATWMEDNIHWIYEDQLAIYIGCAVIQELVNMSCVVDKLTKERSVEAMRRLVVTMTTSPPAPRTNPHLVSASLHPFGHALVVEILWQMRKVCPDNKMVAEVLDNYRGLLKGDEFGNKVLYELWCVNSSPQKLAYC